MPGLLLAAAPGMAKLAPGAEEAAKAVVSAGIPLRGAMGRKWDIAMAAVFLACHGSAFMSGDVLVVDGANWMWRPQLVPREGVSRVSRSVEGKSRGVGIAGGAGAAAPRSKL